MIPAGAHGIIQHITPKSAGWDYVGFSVHDFEPRDCLTRYEELNEFCVVVLTGKATIQVDNDQWSSVGGRENLFSGDPPEAVYIPPGKHWRISAQTYSEVAICSAPATLGQTPARRISPEKMLQETRGDGSNKRRVCNILSEDQAADRLLVVESLTPSGNWSSYPPHKHDTEEADVETRLEETYYHRIDPATGFIFQRVYTDDRDLDETITAEDRDVVLIPRGYHPVGVPHGYKSYYLNVMAGPRRQWLFRNDPAHEWIVQ